MKKDLIRLMTERVALLTHETPDHYQDSSDEKVTFVLASAEEETAEQHDAPVDSVLVDFDYDAEDDSDFQTYMTLRFFWNDWNPLVTEAV